MKKLIPILVTLVVAGWFMGNMRTPTEKTFAFSQFGKLPVTANGRITPMDTMARNALLEIRERQELNLEPWAKGRMISATEWLANVMMNPAAADDMPCFRLDNPELISQLQLPEKDPAKKSDGKHYSWNQISASFDKLDKEFARIIKVDEKERSAYENALVKLNRSLNQYVKLKNTVQPENAKDWPAELAYFEQNFDAGMAAFHAQQAGKEYDTNSFSMMVSFVQRFQAMQEHQPALILPPTKPDGNWRRMCDALLDAPKNASPDAAVRSFANMAGALAGNQPDVFNAALEKYRAQLNTSQPKEVAKAEAESFFNQMQPFYNALVIYVIAALLAFFFWFNLSETLRRTSLWLLWLAFIIHTSGLLYRMILEGRPPVTNLYSSAVFIGWGVVLIGLILEHLYKNGIGAVAASVIGFITLIIAQHLAVGGDTMEMMRAVLDNNFWLAVHVVTITIGYVGTFLAGFLGLIYVLRGVITKTLDASTAKTLARMIYGVVCFATLFSFIGTVTGGIWADYSWGRFWGWDPKENGALIIVLWCALILHLRWGGVIRERGLALCAIGGNIVTAWSWFGVNMLGIGLHSYGFTSAAFFWLVMFAISQIVIIALGLIPTKLWRSFQAPKA